ncbi:exocyst complex component 1 [Musca domestica]|uniref:Exocyst complex component 1 n=1 Tax=Musca domestica TaxID=7370 RepID=A0A1I8M650_MUSDO|nr:exocyst complex component 1 [Musca domestica]
MLSIGSLANIKYILQKELFNGCGERLLTSVTVTKTFKKKRACYLCVVTTPPPFSVVTMCLVKQAEQKDSEYKKKRIWQLDEIKWVDGRSEEFEIHEFDVQVEKLYKWYALNLHERQNFLAVLYKQVQKYGQGRGVKAEFRNIPSAWLMDKSPEKIGGVGGGGSGVGSSDMNNRDGLRKSGAETEDEEESEFQEFTALTDKESNELTKLFTECDYAVKDAELLIEKLSKELHDLDGANIQSVLASEKQVMMLMEHIDQAIGEADKFEERLDSYEEILSHVKETMEKIGGKNAMIKIANNNNIKLKEELSKIITQLDFPTAYQQVLQSPVLNTPEGRKAAIEAAQFLQQALNSDIDPSLQRLAAVRDQMKRFEIWKKNFLGPVIKHLNCLLIHLSNQIGDTPPSSTELILPNHASVHQDLVPYTELMHWIKAMDRTKYEGLTTVYTTAFSKIYERDIRNFFNLAKLQISGGLRNSREDLDVSSSSISKKNAVSSVPHGTLGVNRDQWGPGVDAADRERFDSVLEKVLAELEPIALQEQKFCINFFQMDVISPTAKSVGLDTMDKSTDMSQSILLSPSSATGGGDGSQFPQKKIDRQINEEVRRLMNALFGCLEQELVNFIQSFERFDCFYSLYVLDRLTQHVMSAQDTHSFLSMTFASVLVQVKRNFDRFMQQQLQSIRDAKLPKRSKCGILPYVENFEYFSQTTEEFFCKSTRRTDMDKYIQLINAIFEGINTHAKEHPKTPLQVVRMENYHHMHSLLARLCAKVPSLDELKKEAKARYKDALNNYVICYFGRPLEKLNQFFEGVQQKIAQGVKETEISYQMAFSKQELRKVISQYPAREVKKGMENLYKKVEKHLCEEENLLQVVWHAMQEEFIVQYKFLEERIQKCYAGSMITLEFNIQDILNFFSDIARSH